MSDITLLGRYRRRERFKNKLYGRVLQSLFPNTKIRAAIVSFPYALIAVMIGAMFFAAHDIVTICAGTALGVLLINEIMIARQIRRMGYCYPVRVEVIDNQDGSWTTRPKRRKGMEGWDAV